MVQSKHYPFKFNLSANRAQMPCGIGELMILGFKVLKKRYIRVDVAKLLSIPILARPIPVILGLLAGLNGQDAGSPDPVRITEFPERLFQVQDETGYYWQAFGNGALLSGDTQYLQSGMNLLVNGEAFSPSDALVREPGKTKDRIDIQFSEKRSGYSLTRDLWFDTQRSGVRVFDTFTNLSGSELDLEISLRTTYPFSWQSLHGSGGGLLSSDPALRLGPSDQSLTIHFNQGEGRNDTLLFVASEEVAAKPELRASSNSRELTLIYPVKLSPGESKSLLHWVLQRNLPDLSQDMAALAPFVQGGKLIQPGVDSKLFPQVVNFAPSTFQVETAAPAQLKSLVALNELMDIIGFHRRSEDVLWIGQTNQITGKIMGDSSLSVETPFFGAVRVPLSDIAAIRGGGGQGQSPLIFLRDGRAISGPVTEGEIKWAAGGSSLAAASPEVLDLDEVNLILFGTATTDGIPPVKTTHYLQTTDGSVMALAIMPDTGLKFVNPWGSEVIRWADLVEIGYVGFPHQRWQTVRKGGEILTGFFVDEEISVTTASGDKFNVPLSALTRIWVAGTSKLVAGSFTESWVEFSEVPSELGPRTGFILEGGQLLEGDLVEDFIFLSDGRSQLRVGTRQIAAMHRSIIPELSGQMEVELVSGERLNGELAAPYLRVLRRGAEIEIRSSDILAYRGAPQIP